MRSNISGAVLARTEIAQFLRQASHGHEARARILAYLDELTTTQRYAFYRALKHPLYPLLRAIDRRGEYVDRARAAARAGRVVYVSNHKSHTDYLVQPLVLDDHGVRPPVIAAGINLFGGALGLLHRHITGAVPIRRSTHDPVYLLALKGYVAELLRTHDFFFYLEGGRSYSGDLKPPKTGLLQAALLAEHHRAIIVPTAVAYDLVLEDRVLARHREKRVPRTFSREVAGMVRYAVGYRSRAFVTFGTPIEIRGIDAHARSAVLDLAHAVRDQIGLMYKVLPTAVVAAAWRPGTTRPALESRAEAIIDAVRAAGGNLGVGSGQEAADGGIRALESRGFVAIDEGRVRVRSRHVLRYYARTIEHLLVRQR